MTRAARDLPHLKKFGVHAIWAYSVDSTLNHDSCMVALSGGGIYSMCVIALFHSFYSADNNHTDILDLTLALNGSIDTTRPIWGTNLPDQDDEEEAAADPACGEAAREELKGAGGAGRQPAAYGGGGDGEGEYAYARAPALRARGAEQGVRARQGAAAAPSRSSAHLAGCGADADAVPAARMRGGARRGPGAGVRVTVCVCECKGCGRLALASQQRRGVMEVEGGLEGLTCAKLIMCKRAPRDDASRRVETVLEVIAMKERIGPGCCNGCGPLLATADTTEKVWNTAQKPVKISVHPLPASRPSFSLSYRTIAVVPYLLYCYVADSLETFTQLFSGYHSYCESFHHHNVVLQLGWSDIITAKASISEGMEAGSEQTIGLQRHVTTETCGFGSKRGVFCPVQVKGRMNSETELVDATLTFFVRLTSEIRREHRALGKTNLGFTHPTDRSSRFDSVRGMCIYHLSTNIRGETNNSRSGTVSDGINGRETPLCNIHNDLQHW
ncbi:hypothetical protein B0H14DRAFT_2578040 [Mycena olivaceomarginata]|nr:hypothetical protein B0H14DRAFT_2578040 [Mycena olivaceomarginata]